MREAKAKETLCLNICVLLSLCAVGWIPSSPLLKNKGRQDEIGISLFSLGNAELNQPVAQEKE